MNQAMKALFSMHRKQKAIAFVFLIAMLAGFSPFSFSAVTVDIETHLEIQQTPDGGLQPRLETDEQGNVHLLYFKKRLDRRDAREGNLYYREYDAETLSFGLPVKVSSAAFPLQTVSISRASMAVDENGRVHAIWYLPKTAQYFYSRSNPERTRFESQRSMVIQNTLGIDAGADVAARGDQVAIFWGAGDLSREYERTVFARISDDKGASFGPELQLGNPDLGACACCSLAGEFIDQDNLLIAYRSALEGIGRHMQLLTVEGLSQGITGASYSDVQKLQQWEASFCPLSTNDIALDGEDNLWVVFETEGRIIQQKFTENAVPEAVAQPFTETRQKNPAMAINRAGSKLIVWAEAISHSRGGRLNMRFFESQSAVPQAMDFGPINLDDFSFPATATLPDGRFLVLY